MPCLGIYQQNIDNDFLSEGFLAIFSNDFDGVFYLRLKDGRIFLNDPENEFANSFEEIIEKILKNS